MRTVSALRRAIERLPSDEPKDTPGKWYRTQKQHWLRWLAHYDSAGAYGRKPGMNRDARYAYNHIVEPLMLVYLARSSTLPRNVVARAERAARGSATIMQKSAEIRRTIPWEMIEAALWQKR
jgi:hypothetical protein